MIDAKYCTRSLGVLSPEEILLETTMERVVVTLELYKADVDFAKESGINQSRILRLKYHEWLDRKQTK